jgi:hypothetical protein
MTCDAGITVSATALLYLAFLTSPSAAQQIQHVSFKVAPENNKYVQQLNINVGDVPDHIERVYEIKTTLSNSPPTINGLRITEIWSRGNADITNGNGSGTQYNVFVAEGGDMLFTRNANVVQNPAGQFTATQVGNITGGTGKLAGIHGVLYLTAKFNFQTGVIDTEYTLDYAVGK